MVAPSLRVSLLLSVSLLAAAPLAAQPQGRSAAASAAPVSSLVSQVRIPNQVFKLANGLTVVVHEDRKAPIVAVSTWYNVGSKDEPNGKTGYAHLFEHLMFNGSENLPGDFYNYLQNIGGTDYNGSTFFDRTNYFETVPRGALERALFMESDRMGYFLGAVTQEKLDLQRSVVQNEKRKNDNAPGGLVFYSVLDNLFPAGHPYHHSTIGSMADLDAASLADIQAWFRDKYGPNNAVLVLAGDINAAEARPLVEKYFGSIKRGPVNNPALAAVPAANGKSIVLKDRIAATQIQRYWAVPGMLDKQSAALELGGSVLGGLASSRLDQALVRDEKIAVAVSASNSAFHRVGFFSVTAVVKPGVDPALVEKRLDQLVADYARTGPTATELKRAATDNVAGQIRGLEQVGGFGGKAVALAEGQVYAHDSNFYRRNLAELAAVTPAQVRAVFSRWLTRPPLKIRLEPGDRPPYQESTVKGPSKNIREGTPPPSTKRELPPVASLAALQFPAVERAQLSNGIKVTYARRTAVPLTQMAISFDAGNAADAPAQRGLNSFVLSLLDEGAGGLTSQQIAEREEELGAEIGAGASLDRSTVTLSALSANLGPSLDLVEKIVEQPTFAAGDVERVRTQVLTGIAQAQKDPNGIASRAVPATLYGAAHPYGGPPGGDVAAVKGFTQADLRGFQQRWLRPDNAQIFVVSDRPLAELVPQLEQRFGTWAAPAVAKGSKSFAATPARPTAARIVLIDRPGSPQSVILGAQLTPVNPKGDIIPVSAASEVLGGNFLSRINMDLRETKGWSYGVNSSFALNQNAAPYLVSAPVQADRTGDSIAALNQNITDLLGAKGVTSEELTRLVANNVNTLPGRFETGAAVLSALISNSLYGRPDDYQVSLASKYRALSAPQLDAALKQAVDPKGFVWVVVGDAAKVKPQLDKLGLPVEVAQPR